MTDNTQTQFPTEGQPAFPVVDTENENSADSSTEETTTEETQAPEGEENTGEKTKPQGEEAKANETNFADHPRWKEREDDWKGRFNDQEKRHTEEIQKLREEFGGNKAPSGDEAPSEIPSWFGGDEAQWKEFQTWNQGLVTKAQEGIQKGIQEKTEAEQKAIEEATTFMNDEVSSIESDKTLNPDGIKVDKNKLLKFTMDNELVDTKGRWNYRAAFQLMQAGVKSAKAETIQEKKDVAGATTSEKKAETDKPAYTTTEDFNNPANRPW